MTETLDMGPFTITDWLSSQADSDPLDRLLAQVKDFDPSDPAWISIADEQSIEAQWKKVESARLNGVQLPLYGVPFAVKDNMDAVDFATTAGCLDFSNLPTEDATVVKVLKNAGAILVGKTNLDAFATGLVGTRSQYGAVPNTFDARYISGGSSSGSASVVARGLVPFALGTDTAGSGRVPAGLNNIVGLKGSKGALSTKGVLPACRTLDCVTVLALTVADTSTVFDIAAQYDPDDAYSRKMPLPQPFVPSEHLRVAICENPPWFGDATQQAAYKDALSQIRSLSWQLEPVDFSALFKLADMLYEGPWVAERYAAIKKFIQNPDVTMDPTVRAIIMKAENFSAVDLFEYEYLKADLIRVIEDQFSQFDVILVPTTPTFPTLDDLEREPVRENSRLGTYTNFVNFMDWSAISVPAGFRSDGLPFGLTLISDCWQEQKLLHLGTQWLSTMPARHLGVIQARIHEEHALAKHVARNYKNENFIPLAVVGAHLSGLPLNHQLTDVGARFRCSTKTSPKYRLHLLRSNSLIQKPGLQRVPAGGVGGSHMAIEIWDVPVAAMGNFVAKVPSPLAIGSVELMDGSWINGFVCEPYDLFDTLDITAYGGWIAYLDTLGPQADASGKIEPIDVRPKPLFNSVLVANRGEIAVRIISTLKKLGIKSIAVYSREDRDSSHVWQADSAYLLDGEGVLGTYLSESAILDIAKLSNAKAIIPGYGFLSESSSFAELCEAQGLVWVGPTPQQMRDLGLKASARKIAQQVGVPLLPGSGLLDDVKSASLQAECIGYPVMVKSNAGGGGIGLQQCWTPEELRGAVESVCHLGRSYFNDGSLFIEKFVQDARHVEVQIMGNGRGQVRDVSERDCSLQRRKQKVIEEGPATFVPEMIRKRMREAALKLAAGVSYRGVGTVEFLYDIKAKDFFFLEVNTRLQVEHPVTEAISGLDLVEVMLRIACDQADDIFTIPLPPKHFALEARIYGESPLQNFRPSPGQLTEVSFPPNARVDTWIEKGSVISPIYDPLLAKIIVTGNDRPDAVQELSAALDATHLSGIETNVEYLRAIVKDPSFVAGEFTTTSLSDFKYESAAIEVIEAGPSTSIQDFPGRVGLWHVGIPPSGPRDNYSFRLANRILGNDSTAAALECTTHGPILLFHSKATIAIVGGSAPLFLDDIAIPFERAVHVQALQKLRLGTLYNGCRTYIAVRGGLRVPEVMGSRSTFEIGKLGGHSGRSLRAGDIIHVGNFIAAVPLEVNQALLSRFTNEWTLRAITGPHGSPDFITPDSFQELFQAPWKVHYNSNRIGVRLTGPRPAWSRSTGGEAGLHPSNIHDSPYSIGSISFTGDDAVILTCDGPSLGGFVVFAVIIEADMWKLGQVKPGDSVYLKPSTLKQARLAMQSLEMSIENTTPLDETDLDEINSVVENTVEPVTEHIVTNDLEIWCRQAGDRALLLDFGKPCFNIQNNVVIYALLEQNAKSSFPGVEELTIGSSITRLASVQLKDTVGPSGQMHTWLPSNTTFLKQVNGLSDKTDIDTTLFSSTYLVLGLGDVFCGSPCAIPLDPRHRLFGMKYNPPRSYTAEGTVGVGGQYLCIYAIDSPGGYQLIGRTSRIWNSWLMNHAHDDMRTENPWIFRLFDQIKFFPVEEHILDEARDKGTDHKLIKIEQGAFDVKAYQNWLIRNDADIQAVQLKRWKILNESNLISAAIYAHAPSSGPQLLDTDAQSPEVLSASSNVHLVRSAVSGKCWKCAVRAGDTVKKDQTLFSIEAMKMELDVKAPHGGKCLAVYVDQGSVLGFNDPMAAIEIDNPGQQVTKELNEGS